MSDKILRKYLARFSQKEIKTFRFAFAATLSMAVAMGFDWMFAYLVPVLTMPFITSPKGMPNLKEGAFFIIVIAIADYLSISFGEFLTSYPVVFLLLVFLAFFHIYYALYSGSLSPTILLWLLLTMISLPLVILELQSAALLVARGLFLGGVFALIVTWISFTLFPDKPTPMNITAKKQTKLDENFIFKNSLANVLVVFPVYTLFYFYGTYNYLLALIYIALLTMTPDSVKSGKVLVYKNFIGGLTGVLIYEILVLVPSYPFMLLLILGVSLIFGRKIYFGDAKDAMTGTSFSTALLIVGSATGKMESEAEAMVYSRILQIFVALFYVAAAFKFLDVLKRTKILRKIFGLKEIVVATMLFAVFSLHGCKMGPDYTRPAIDTLAVNYTFSENFSSAENIADLPWWEMFGDTVLQNLISEGLENNRNLRSALARVEEARANLNIVRADLYPSVNYSGKGSYDAISESDGTTTSPSALAAVDVSYQLDLWGRVKRLNEAALAEYLATEEAYRAITITLVSEIASAYILLRDIDNRLLVSEHTAETRRKSLDVIKARYDAGMVAEVDVNQAEIQLADAEAAVKTYERLRTQTENAINLLLSRPPQKIPRGKTLQEQIFPPELPAGLPSDLLNRRPDLREAEKKLEAQTARIGAAEALKYPQVTLSANAGLQYSDLTSAFAGLAAQIVGPIFNAGAYDNQVKAEIARTKQLLNNYEQTFYAALRETEDAMVAVNTYKKEFEIRKEQVKSAQSAADLSWVRYEGGLTSYLEVLDLQRSLFTAQLKASETLQMELSSVIRLYKALGGGWNAVQDTTFGTKPLETNKQINKSGEK